MARLLDGDADDYHERPGLSSSIATILLARSPAHAFAAHPLGGGEGKPRTDAMDRGSVIHSLSLGKGKQFEICDFADWRTKAAQAARDTAREAGKIPILSSAFEDAAKASAAIIVELGERGIYLDGESEQGIEWEESSAHGPVLCRAMFDHVWLAAGRILDLKVTHDAAPNSVERSAENFGYAIQACAYQRALAALRPELAGRTDFVFAFCEPEPPYAMNLCRGDGSFRELGERRWLSAVATWGRCLAENNWPAYGPDINWIAPPAWALAREGF